MRHSTNINIVKCMLINVRSINNKLYKLTELLLDRDVDVCCVTETWLRDGTEPVLADLKREGFDVVSCPRNDNRRGGGIAFVSKSGKYISKMVKTYTYQTFELQEVILFGKIDNIRFSIIYRTGYLDLGNKETFLNELNDYLELIVSMETINIVLGDFNIRLDNNDKLAIDFMDVMESKGFRQIINEPTHVDGGMLDLVFLPFDFSIVNLEILNNHAISDHYPIEFEIPLTITQLPTHYQAIYRNVSQIDSELFRNNIKPSMQSISSLTINNAEDLNNSLVKINNALLCEIDIQAPYIKKKLRVTKHIIKNKDIQEARRIKRRAEKRYKKTRLETDKINLVTTRKNLIKVVENSRNKFFIEKFSLHKYDIKQTYNVINQLLDKNNEKILPSHSVEKSLANKFAKFYKEKIEGIRNNLGSITPQLFDAPLHIVELSEFKPVGEEEVITAMKSLENKQTVMDPIPCKLMKMCQNELLPALLKLINSSFNLGLFPDDLKTAIVTPIIKSTRLDPELLNNYRPLSGLPVVEKLIEKLALKQLLEHLNHNNLYCKYQSAYRTGHSCETALMKIYDDVMKYISPTSYVVIVFLDFSAAFDTIDHGILIKRLSCDYGIKDKALNWFDSYLKHRNYKVKINNTLSEPTELNFGVPQGSILGPILFSLYIKDIKNIALSYNLNVHFYADDVQLYMKCNSNTDFTNLLNCLDSIKSWTNNNFLKLNSSKTKLLTACSNTYKSHKVTELKIMGETIKVDNSVRNLGFILDEHLSMAKQINQVCAHGYGMLRNLWRISKRVIDKELRTQLVHSGILSRVNYCNSLYVSLPNSQTRKLQKLINASVRFILNIRGKDRFQHITPHLQSLHFLPIKYRIAFKICLMAYKCVYDTSPLYLQELLNLRQPNWNQSLRKDNDISLLDYKSIETRNYKSRGFSYVAPVLWNKLPSYVRNSPSVTAFKNNLKTLYFTEWKQGKDRSVYI